MGRPVKWRRVSQMPTVLQFSPSDCFHDRSGEHNYTIHFPGCGLPPSNAFWSLTIGDARNRFVANSINRYSVSDRSGLVPNADGSVDIHIQNTSCHNFN